MIRHAFVLIKIFYRERSEGGDKFEAEPYPLPDRFEVRSTEASYDDYLRNLGVIRQSEQKRLQEHYSVARDRRNDIRYKTFIPDYCSEVRDIGVIIITHKFILNLVYFNAEPFDDLRSSIIIFIGDFRVRGT